ncbi:MULTISPECIES: 4'-phosphopantetheinyl transferase family protein [Flammeovirga]|uniref:4'-phosphopantetheinyl transferase superfamily protein n=1 Tax=Flammeovirga agarivorans TaxID=2726742 RepID=A0A7X8XUW4_9BACT|nr:MULTISPECIES: 4'-phosphopantetheinyl transferase superfamily protein [Flammeovirga]NLR90782.1 4'-phosphopantetheinyl transferase superfamily protein [Flammeovirga agarivorans]
MTDTKPYNLNTTTVDSIQGELALLDGDELKRYKRFISPIKKEEFLKARTFLKHILAKELGLKPKQISFSYTKNGKPFLSNIYGKKNYHFNISHSNGYLVVVTSQQPIGIDLEPISKLDEDKLKWFLSEQEINEIKSIQNEDARKIALFQLFTMKEAFIKATDKSYLLDNFSFWYVNGKWQLQIGEDNNWEFDLKTIGNEVAIAICYAGK